MLRNPSQQKKSFDVDVMNVFELPNGFENNYSFFDARSESADNQKHLVGSGKSFTIYLDPFEVKVMDGIISQK